MSKYTRRKFIQMTIQAGSTVGVSGLAIIPDFRMYSTPVICNSCNANIDISLLTVLLKQGAEQFCPNCGIHLSLHSYPIDSNCNCNAAQSGEFAPNTLQGIPSCCQVPFPVQHLDGCTEKKPIFNIANLNF